MPPRRKRSTSRKKTPREAPAPVSEVPIVASSNDGALSIPGDSSLLQAMPEVAKLLLNTQDPKAAAAASLSTHATSRPMGTSALQQHWGQVRASPFGACLVQNEAEADENKKASDFHRWRATHLKPLEFPKEGFDHVYGQATIDEVDSTPLKPKDSALGAMPMMDPSGVSTVREEKEDGGGGNDEDDRDGDVVMADPVLSNHPEQQQSAANLSYHDYGSTKTPDDAPVGSLKDKWRLLP